MLAETKPLPEKDLAHPPLRHQHIDAIVSGRNWERREASLVAFLSQAFFDESGDPNKKKLIIGGYTGHVEMWKRFSDDWQCVLDGDLDGLPPWPMFHGVEAENGKDGFGVLDKVQRVRRIAALVNVIASHKPKCVVVIIDNQKFTKEVDIGCRAFKFRPKKGEYWRNPYSYGACNLSGAMFYLQDAVNKREQHDLGTVEVVFDHMDKMGVALESKVKLAVVDWAKKTHPPHVHDRIKAPRWLEKGEKKHIIPMQAADLLMWHYGRKHNEGDNRSALRCLKLASRPHYVGEAGGVDSQNYWIGAHLCERYLNELRKQIEKKPSGRGFRRG